MSLEPPHVTAPRLCALEPFPPISQFIDPPLLGERIGIYLGEEVPVTMADMAMGWII